MNEADYWLNLEYRVSTELTGMLDNHLRFLWCDGFTATENILDGPNPRVTGKAWICNGPRQAEWGFTLFLSHSVGSGEKIDWASFLPGKNVTRGLALDQVGKC